MIYSLNSDQVFTINNLTMNIKVAWGKNIKDINRLAP